jgi:hypothetical protein
MQSQKIKYHLQKNFRNTQNTPDMNLTQLLWGISIKTFNPKPRYDVVEMLLTHHPIHSIFVGT